MFKFDEKQIMDSVEQEMNHRQEIEQAADKLSKEDFQNIFLIGIGGTYAVSSMIEATFRPISKIPVFLENAADTASVGNASLTNKSLVIVSSMSGQTPELTAAIRVAKEKGAIVVGFIDVADCEMAGLADQNFAFPGSTYGKYFIFVAAYLWKNGLFDCYEEAVCAFSQLGSAMVEIGKAADCKARAFAEKHWNDDMLYVSGAGNLWGCAYTLAMCYMEEMLWMRTKSISCADFFHGTLEVIEKNTNLLVMVGEDAARCQAERVIRFANTVCDNVEVFDISDYETPGVDADMRKLFAPMIMQAVYARIVANLEDLRKHPTEIRRYYHRLAY